MLFRTIALILVVAHIQGETLHGKKVIRASFDRIEGDFAVVYYDHDEDDDDDHHYNKFDVPLELLKDAKPGMRLKLHIENDQIKRIEIDKEATEGARDRIHKKYERLRQGRHLR
jgi:Protein of unknown function (DUF3006)